MVSEDPADTAVLIFAIIFFLVAIVGGFLYNRRIGSEDSNFRKSKSPSEPKTGPTEIRSRPTYPEDFVMRNNSRVSSKSKTLPDYRIKLEVKSDKGSPISNAKISLLRQHPSRHLYEENTNNSGTAYFDLGKGNYPLIVEKEGYGSYKENISIPPENLEIPVTLRQSFGNIKIKTVDSSNKIPVPNVKVSINREGYMDSTSTNNKGEVVFSGIPLGGVEIKTELPLYKSSVQTYSVEKDTTHDVEVSLTPEAHMPAETSTKLQNAKNRIDKSYGEVSVSFDACVTGYMRDIGANIIDFITDVANTPVYFTNAPEEYTEVVNSLADGADIISKGISEEVLTKKRNIDLYSAIKRKFNNQDSQECTTVSGRDNQVTELISNPERYISLNESSVSSKVSTIDNELTTWSSKVTISPVLDLWNIAKQLMEASSASPIEKATRILLADILLDYVKSLLDNSEVTKRLGVSVL